MLSSGRSLKSRTTPVTRLQFAVPLWAGTKPFQQLVFQWSCHVEARHGELEHAEFLDTSGEAPMRAAAESLLDAIGDRGPIFVYHDFEKWRLMEMAADKDLQQVAVFLNQFSVEKPSFKLTQKSQTSLF